MSQSIDKNATRNLVTFIQAYTDMLEKSLVSIQGSMRDTVEGVMKGINDISNKTAAKKREANEVLVNTYTKPDAEAAKAMASAQDEVNQIMNSAASAAAAAPPLFTAVNGNVDGDSLRRSSGLFSKHMEAMETLDGDLQGMLVTMMGALSQDDVISQKIEHVTSSLNALQTSLTYLLTDFSGRCNEEGIARFAKDLKAVVFRSYTMEDEKKIFYSVFPEDRPVKPAKKAS